MDFEFSIPLSRDDLLTKTGVDQYVVEEVYSMRIMPSKLQEFKAALRTKGALTVLQCFDSIYSLLKNFHQVESGMKEEAWELMVKVIAAQSKVLTEVLDSELDPEVCQVHRNVLKMNCYLLCQLMDMMEDEISRATAAAAVGGKGKKARQYIGDSWTIDWDVEKERGALALLKLMQLNIHRLWTPPVIEEEFTSLVTNCCYKMLENPGINRKHSLQETLFNILGYMVKKHNHGIAFTLKTVQLLQHFEHLAATMARAVQILATTFHAKTIIMEIMREIGRMDAKDLTKDTSGTRTYAAFMVDLAEKVPELMLPGISVILDLLDGESYNMRNSVLGILGEIVIHVLSKDGLDNQQKSTRDEILDMLEDHVHDVHALVRSKTMQIWTHIVNEKALPLPRQHSLLKLVIGRLEDKSSHVRKYAVQLVSALLRTNPFAAKLPLEELKDNYEKESKKLEDMIPPTVKVEPVDPAEDGVPTEEEEAWKKIKKDVKDAIAAVLGGTDDQEDDSNLITDTDSIDSVTERILSFLKDTQNKEAVHLYIMARGIFPDEPPFCFATVPPLEPVAEGEDQPMEEDSEEARLTLDGLRKMFTGEPMVTDIEPPAPPTADHVPDGLVNEVSKQQILVHYLKDSMEFVNILQEALPMLCLLLESKNNTDVLETIEFFVASYEFGLNNAMIGVRRMLGLIWSKEQNIKEAVVEAYKRLYLQSDKDSPRAWAASVAKNLTELTIGASLGELVSLEGLISEFSKSGDLPVGVLQILWERFAMKIPGTTPAESRGALIILGMAAMSDQDIVKSNIEVLVKEGLGVRGEDDLHLAKDTFAVLLKMAKLNQPREGKQEEPFKFPQDHEIFQRVKCLLVSGLRKTSDTHWIGMAEEAVNVTYMLGEHPDLIFHEIMMELVSAITEIAGTGLTPDTPESESEEGTEPSEESTVNDQLFSVMLTRFLSISGHIALRHLVHLDVSIFNELRRRHAIQEREKEKEIAAHTAAVAAAASARKKGKKGKQQPEELSMEEEMGLTGAVAEDAEAEYIRKITEEHLVNGTSNLLSLLGPIIITVCSNPLKFPDPNLQRAASLALAKYMTVSSVFCEEHLQLLFTILEKSPHPAIRANSIVALGNITFRFPNLIEPWTAHLYARLRDESTHVRKNTLMMLTHLILNDMVKVKGQISELASCMVDYDRGISNLAKLFFHELAKKGNAIYNIMPDIISRLSDPEVGVDEDSFRTIMRYLFGFIQKDRQCENLVEKLCHRFRVTRVERQWRDLAFCLSLLTYSEKSIRKLQENEACFLDKLSDEDVYNSITTIISSVQKLIKPETKTIIDEFEQRVEVAHNKGVEDSEAFAKAKAASSAAKTRNPRTPGKRRAPGKSRAAAKTKSKGDSDEEEEAEFTNIKPRKKSTRQRKKVVFSSDEEELELFEVQMQEEQGTNTHKTQTGARARATSGQQEESDQENADPNVTYSSPNPVKRRHKSVCSKSAKTPPPTTRPRRAARKGAA